MCQITLFQLSNKANRVCTQVLGALVLETTDSNLLSHFSIRYFSIGYPAMAMTVGHSGPAFYCSFSTMPSFS
jgi:hypothetical protein